ncbi:MAG: transglycosylase SLT domain-containing protein [Muribaculaceae bacterium]|nr:transglycosylase SLT domain-containing protein [Muribaculaceae bacterium]
MKKFIYNLLLICAASGIALPAMAKENKTVLDIKESISDSNIVYPESFEADTRKMMEGWYMKNYMATDDRYKKLDDTRNDDNTIRERLAKLPTIIELPYNKVVRSYIDRYTKQGREQVTVLLGLSHYYLPIFEQALEERGLPLELKYLPVIESGLNPNAVSKHGAAGLWQFMLATAKGMGMEVNSLVDERRDPYLSSRKAAQYLSDLYATYNDWSLAIAAYNCGPGAVNKAIRRAGGDPKKHDFWSIYNYLTPETRGYVPMFIAANYVMNYYPEHNISPVIPTKPLITDTLHISSPIHFNQISAVLDIPVEELRVLNPQFRADMIPASADRSYTLVLPSQQVHAYLMSEDAIKNYEAEKYAHRRSVEPGDAPLAQNVAQTADAAPTVSDTSDSEAIPVASAPQTKGVRTVTHKVKPGESLASIASTYGVTPEEIKKVNSLRRNSVRTGQLLRINTATTEGVAETPAEVNMTPDRSEQTWQASAPTTTTSGKKTGSSQAKTQQKQKQAAATSHKLKNGDTLSSLSKKYGVSIADIKKANGMTSDRLRAGETLKIPAKSSGSSSRSSGSKSSKKSKKRRR